MKPAPPGTGVVAGGGVRAILEMAGVRDVYAKFIGSRNPLNGVRAGLEGLNRIKEIEDSVRFRRRE
jgi:small subunit ribosomal protein S5